VSRLNAIGLGKLKFASPFLNDLCPAGDRIPSLGERDVLHAGVQRLSDGIRCELRRSFCALSLVP